MRILFIPTSEVTDEMIHVCTQESIESARKSIDGTETMLSYKTPTKPLIFQIRKDRDFDVATANKRLRSSVYSNG